MIRPSCARHRVFMRKFPLDSHTASVGGGVPTWKTLLRFYTVWLGSPTQCNLSRDKTSSATHLAVRARWLGRPLLRTAQDFVSKLLRVDPRERLTAAEAANHPWIASTNLRAATDNLTGMLDSFRLYQAKRKLRAAVDVVSTPNQSINRREGRGAVGSFFCTRAMMMGPLSCHFRRDVFPSIVIGMEQSEGFEFKRTHEKFLRIAGQC